MDILWHDFWGTSPLLTANNCPPPELITLIQRWALSSNSQRSFGARDGISGQMEDVLILILLPSHGHGWALHKREQPQGCSGTGRGGAGRMLHHSTGGISGKCQGSLAVSFQVAFQTSPIYLCSLYGGWVKTPLWYGKLSDLVLHWAIPQWETRDSSPFHKEGSLGHTCWSTTNPVSVFVGLEGYWGSILAHRNQLCVSWSRVWSLSWLVMPVCLWVIQLHVEHNWSYSTFLRSTGSYYRDIFFLSKTRGSVSQVLLDLSGFLKLCCRI